MLIRLDDYCLRVNAAYVGLRSRAYAAGGGDGGSVGSGGGGGEGKSKEGKSKEGKSKKGKDDDSQGKASGAASALKKAKVYTYECSYINRCSSHTRTSIVVFQ